jgi:hypothetical protein
MKTIRLRITLVALMLSLSMLLFTLQELQADHITINASISALTTTGFTPFLAQFTVSVGPSSSAGCLADKYTVNWGDGSSPFTQGTSNGPNNLAHLYTVDGTYEVTLEYSMEGDHGDGRGTLDCKKSNIFSSVTVMANDEVEIPNDEELFQFDFEGTIFDLYEKLEELRGRLAGAQSLSTRLSMSEPESLDSIMSALDGLLVEAELLVQEISMQIEPLLFLEELAGTVLLTHLGNIKLMLDDPAEGAREKLGQARFNLAARLFDDLTREIDLIVITVKDGDFNWMEFESVVPFALAYKCNGSFVTISGAFSNIADKGMIMGTNLADVIAGSPLRNEINALGGDDIICAGAGDDLVMGGLGNDTIFGGDGIDELRGEAGNDIIFGQSGSDMLWGGPGDDELDGGDGSDELHGEGQDDVLYGGPSGDFLFGEDGSDSISGGAGLDYIDGGTGIDFLDGGEGSDVLIGGANDDIIKGGIGSDTLMGDAGNDTLEGEGNSDTLFGGPGNDILKGQNEGGPLENDFCDGGTGTDIATLCLNQVNIP